MKPQSQQKINDTVNYERRLKLHTKAITDKANFKQQHFDFLHWVSDDLGLDKEKQHTFNALFKPPFQTVELCESVFSVISSVFNAKNPFFKFNFNVDNLESDFEAYRAEKLKDFEYFQTRGINTLQNNPSAYVVVDLPRTQESERPEPYFYFLNIDRVIDVLNTETTSRELKTEYIIFEASETTVAAFDDEFYRIFSKDDQGNINTNEGQFIEIPHNLGYCPVKSFWHNFEEENNIKKSNPITNSLTSLDFLLFFMIGKEHNNLYDFFSIWWTFQEQEGFDHDVYTTSELEEINEHYKETNPAYLDNIITPEDNRKKKLRGAGSIIEKPMPTDDMPDIGEPIGRMKSDVPLLEFINKDLALREDRIFFSSVGKNNIGDVLNTGGNKTATEIKASFESRKKILMRVKANFEVIHKWTLDTIIKLRYVETSFISSVIDYGNEFFLFSLPELQKEYEHAKEAGMPESELILILEEMIGTKYRNNPDKREELKILLNIEPLPTKTSKEVFDLAQSNNITEIDFQIKINFPSFVKRFERENGSILTFGENQTFEIKINTINEAFKNYATEKINGLVKIETP